MFFAKAKREIFLYGSPLILHHFNEVVLFSPEASQILIDFKMQISNSEAVVFGEKLWTRWSSLEELENFKSI